ncbi:DUF6167 family protein [Streptomyces sp. DSM 44915]|uniref:DUF6167 family protein n=1 Tax=Streptomyces chisholmiae TaxID=3075540 RepID=A0ABU2JVA3_9ACTN|nr:DUF6167 family protein [Streptomyces sp. DSM 44915]MDT0268905.1 DUF6167 family protein [Streptomyces sp. DSM 44915]
MIRRALWFTTGAVAGVWATTKVQRQLRRLTPESLAGRAADRAVTTGHRLREFAVDVRSGMAEREDQLHDALGLSAAPPPGRVVRAAAPRRPLPPARPAQPATPAEPALADATERSDRTAPLPRSTGKEDH